MARREGHGETHAPTRTERVGAFALRTASALRLAGRSRSFGHLAEWAASDRLPEGPGTLAALRALGDAMREAGDDAQGSGIPAAYTYLGQFVDHDITKDASSASVEELGGPDLAPLSGLGGLVNARTATLDLDSVYGRLPDAADEVRLDPDDPRKLRLGQVTPLNGTAPPTARPPGKSDLNDLDRQGRSDDPGADRAALIGDPRNDENIIVAQLHAAFVKAHNSLVDEGLDFAAARRALTLRYQSLVLDDFLARVCDPDVHARVLSYGPSRWSVGCDADLFMPAEFAFAAYRFGHSMVRTTYDYNLNFNPVGLDQLFSFTALSGQIGGTVVPGGFDTVPDNWIIQWERIADLGSGSPQEARPINALLTSFLFELRDVFGEPEPGDLAPVLAKRNLLRGYLVGLPTGQALARHYGLPALSGQDLLDALPDALRAAAYPFRDRTPLWFYVLAEAGDPSGPGGRHLGPLGSTVLMDTFWRLVEFAPTSLLSPGDADVSFRPFALADLLRLAARQDEAATTMAATAA